MKKRIALVSYADCKVAAFGVQSDMECTTVTSTGDTREPELSGVVVASVEEGPEGVSVSVLNGDQMNTIKLSAVETERLLVALTSHMRMREGMNLELYRKG